MPGFTLHVSNRTEVLLEELAAVVASPLSSPLESETIVVQSQGMERWLSQKLAERFGIWANCSFPFPKRFLTDLFQRVLHGVPDDLLYSPDVLTWRILGLLGSFRNQPGFEPLAHYLTGDEIGLKRFQLARRIANIFDDYLVYRPDMLLGWETGNQPDWQAQLWRRLVQDLQIPHLASLRRLFLRMFSDVESVAADLPSRISVFGIPSLPPFHLEILSALARHVEVHLFFMNPCREYWGDIVSEKGLARLGERRKRPDRNENSQHYEVGNPLLSSLGKLGRDFFDQLIGMDGVKEESRFVEPAQDSLLHCLQADILELRDRRQETTKELLAHNDRSLQIHSCHSPLREMEVLYDQLLDFFTEHTDLAPKDVLVMAPDIDVYAPFISAVFGHEQANQSGIPFAIADRTPAGMNAVVIVFLKILDLADSRLTLSQVLDLLDSPPVRHKFQFGAADMELIRSWLDATRVRWGIDADHRQRHRLPPFESNSWQAGLHRLLLGYALPSHEEQLFAQILPFDAVEGSECQVLGRLAEFLEQLFSAVRSIDHPRNLEDWSQWLLGLVESLLAVEEEAEPELQFLRRQLVSLEEAQNQSGLQQTIGVEVLRCYLERQLAVSEQTPGFLSGGVTFCALLPMRSIPFRVIALVGMNHDTFPRSHFDASFDLISRAPRPGDRSLRDEDRYLFLEALLSAREHFYVSYVGQSILDNSEIPPSVLISELTDYLEQSFLPSSGFQTVSEQIYVRHRLQPFNPCYFEPGSRLFSYSEENLEALKARQLSGTEPSPFVAFPVAEPTAEWQTVEIRNLKRFFRNPGEYFLRQRLGIRLEEGHETEDREPFTLDGLEAYGLKQELLERRLNRKDPVPLYAAYRAKGILPEGEAGRMHFELAAVEAERMGRRLDPLTAPELRPPLDLEEDFERFHLSGRIDGIRSGHLLRYRCAAVKSKDRLNTWIDHLLLNTYAREGDPLGSVLAGRDGQWSYTPVPESRAVLQCLLELYWRGLTVPLRFFPEAAYVYAAAIHTGKPSEQALAEAVRGWKRSYNEIRAEEDDPFNQLGFGKINPLGDEFRKLALDVFLPLLEHQQEEKS